MFCIACGSPLNPEAPACTRCGTPRAATGNDPQVPQAPSGPPAYGQPGAPGSTPWVPGGGQPPASFPPQPGSYPQPGGPPAAPGSYSGGQPPAGTWPPGPAPTGAPGGKKGKLGALVVVAGLLATAVVGVLVYRGVTGSGGGAKSPEAAVEKLADAVTDEDPVAAIAALDPDEVRSLGELYESTESKAEKLGLAGKDKTFAGVDLRVEDLEYEVEKLGDDVAKVTFTDGTLRYDVKVKDLPDRVQSAAESELEDNNGRIDQKDLRYRRDGAERDRDPFLMVTKRDGGWYVSPFFTLGEYIVDIGDEPEGDFDAERKEELTADNPEDAVRQFSDAIESLDPDEVIDRMADDTRVLRAYRKAITDAMKAEVTDCSGSDCDVQDLDLSIDDLELESADLGKNKSKVTIKGVKGDYRYTDADGDSIDESFEFDGTCITTSNSDEDDENCLDDETARFGIKEAFVVVVKEDGRWAVSPMETLIEYGRTVLAEVDDNLVRRFTNSMHEVEKVERVDLNDQFDAELNDAGWATYEVDLEENQTISVEVDESDLDGYASSTVFDPDGKELEGYDSITAPSDGTYRVVIEVDSFKEETVPVTLAAVPEEQIELGSEVDASLDSDTPVRDFVFEGEAGDSIEITIDDSNLDLEVLDPDGVTIYSDEGDVYELDRSGTYRVRVRSYDGESADFSLLVQPPPLFLVDGEEVTSVEGSLTDAFDIEYYSIEVRAGAELTLTITPDPLFDPMISIYDPDSVISEENAAGPGVKEVFELSADTNGTWYLEVSTPADVAGGFKLDIVEVN